MEGQGAGAGLSLSRIFGAFIEFHWVTSADRVAHSEVSCKSLFSQSQRFCIALSLR